MHEPRAIRHREACTALWDAYTAAPLAQRALAALRPLICPLDPLVRHVGPQDRVLDIGCGNGLFLAVLCRFRGLTSGIGVDANPTAIAAARAMARAQRLPLAFAVGTSASSWPKGPFDAVTMVDVMHHVPHSERRSLFTEALAYVAPGGRILYKDMCAKPWWRVAWNAAHDLVLARQLVHVEPLVNVIGWARDGGFAPVFRDTYAACGVYGHELVVFQRDVRSLATVDLAGSA